MRGFVDCCGTRQYLPIPQDPSVRVVSGPAVKLVLTAPSWAVVGEPFRAHVRAEDMWGNPAAGYRGAVTVSGASGSPKTCRFAARDNGARWLNSVRLNESGVYRLEAHDEQCGLTATSNPIVCQTTSPALKPFWGDLHGQSEEALGLNSAFDYFRFARDVAAVDLSVNQGNDFDIDAEGWKQIKAATRKFNEPGRFAAFLGYEWSGNISGGGDRADAVTELSVGQWSDWWLDSFTIDGTEVRGYVRMKLITLTPNADQFELFAPQIWPAEGYTKPLEVTTEIDQRVGNFLQNPARDALGIVDDDTYFELLEFHHQRLADVAQHLMSSPRCTLIRTRRRLGDLRSDVAAWSETTADHGGVHEANVLPHEPHEPLLSAPEPYVNRARRVDRWRLGAVDNPEAVHLS